MEYHSTIRSVDDGNLCAGPDRSVRGLPLLNDVHGPFEGRELRSHLGNGLPGGLVAVVEPLHDNVICAWR